MKYTIPILTGQKVRLRPIDLTEDYKAWYEVSQDEKMHLWVGNNVPTDYEEIKELLNLYTKYFILWMIEDIKTNQVIGMMRISYPEKTEEGQVAGDSQRLHSNYWRKGYMKEARKLIYNYVFNELKVDVLYADVWEGNINSSKSLESVGYRHFDTKEEYFKKYNRMQNKLYYKLKANWWEEIFVTSSSSANINRHPNCGH
ncbi:GNAT family N-acetyltransferase [Clostridiaceae bacterium M8S5]|nr:GNAT family N-acetyltransferase [Clostridiaceae bacterium M8S5]